MKKGRIAGLIVVALVAGGGFLLAQGYADREADRRVEHFLTKLPKGTSVKYRSAGYSLWSGKVRLRDLSLASAEAGEARIKGITVTSFDKFHRVPHYVKLKVRGFEMRRDKANPQTRLWMDRLGYKTIVVDVDYIYRYRADLRELTIERARISGPQVGTLVLSGRFGNVKSLDVRTLGDLIAIGMQAVPRGMRAVYTDDSLTDRLIGAYAAEAGEDKKVFQARLVKDIDAEMRAHQEPQFAPPVAACPRLHGPAGQDRGHRKTAQYRADVPGCDGPQSEHDPTDAGHHHQCLSPRRRSQGRQIEI